MNRNTKIVLYSIGGLVLLTGLGFGIRALFKKDDDSAPMLILVDMI